MDAEKERKKRKIVSKDTWEEIKYRYIFNKETARSLGDEYGISEHSIRKMSSRHGWTIHQRNNFEDNTFNREVLGKTTQFIETWSKAIELCDNILTKKKSYIDGIEKHLGSKELQQVCNCLKTAQTEMLNLYMLKDGGDNEE